jgi:hypothetical protein
MPSKSSKKRPAKNTRNRVAARPSSASPPRLSPRAGLPARDSIVGVVEFTPFDAAQPFSASSAAAPAVSKYRMIITDEQDEYEKPEPAGAPGLELFFASAAAVPDDFKGKERRPAKLSVANARTEKFDDLKDLIASLVPDEDMIDRYPPIKRGETSRRVKEEKRNVSVKAFLYAHSVEDDHDYHLIIGRDPQARPEMYMTAEVSGLPPAWSASRKELQGARDSYKSFFGSKLPGQKYVFPDPPIPVFVKGSLFFDVTHAGGTSPGPKSLKSRMPTIWEIHPVTKIKFEP